MADNELSDHVVTVPVPVPELVAVKTVPTVFDEAPIEVHEVLMAVKLPLILGHQGLMVD